MLVLSLAEVERLQAGVMLYKYRVKRIIKEGKIEHKISNQN